MTKISANSCYDCGAGGHKIGEDYAYDIMHCDECHAEWAEGPGGEDYPPCYYCGEPCGNPQGRHYQCACENGEDLDRTTGFNDLSHIW